MSLFITQCPHCRTSFRTSISQLQSADGMVRCGACLRVFPADDNLLPLADLRTINVPFQEEIEETETFDEQLPITELEIEDDGPEEEQEADPIFTLDMADSVPNRLNPGIATDEPTWELIDEDFAADKDSGDDAPTEEKPALKEEDEGDAEELEEEFLASSRADLTPTLEESETSPPTLTTEPTETAQIRSRLTAIDFDDERLNDSVEIGNFTRLSAEEIEGISDAATPLEIDWQETPSRNNSQVVWWLLGLLLTLGLSGQFLWFNKDSLSQNTSLRPLLNGFCTVLRCELPPLVDITAIRSDNLVVRSHDEVANALSVHFQFQNNANFPQPFPGVTLRFTDAAGTVIAQRNFAPSEYLPEGVADLQLMPSNSPIQVTLDILDPGGKAINYELSFYESELD